MVHRNKPRSLEPSARTTAGTNRRDTLRREIAQKIAEWADPHDSCIVPGCRRNKRCLLPDACRGFSDEPLDDETAAIVRRNLRALKAYADGGPMPDEQPT
jgi:hypothetical protein